MGWPPKDGDTIKLNGAFFTLCTTLRFIVALAAKAELRALFLNWKEGIFFWLTLEELGHPHPRTPVHCDNATSVGIANNTIKRQRSRWMEMRYLWVSDKEAQDIYKIKWHSWQAPHRLPSSGSSPLVLTQNKFVIGIAKSNKTKHSERMCWEPPWGLHT